MQYSFALQLNTDLSRHFVYVHKAFSQIKPLSVNLHLMLDDIKEQPFRLNGMYKLQQLIYACSRRFSSSQMQTCKVISKLVLNSILIHKQYFFCMFLTTESYKLMTHKILYIKKIQLLLYNLLLRQRIPKFFPLLNRSRLASKGVRSGAISFLGDNGCHILICFILNLRFQLMGII